MSKENDNNFDHYNEIEDEMIEKSPKEKSKPWNSKFSENENLKNRQYSRSARNQPVKEASTVSKVLLLIIALIVIIPFVLFGIIQAQRNNKEIVSRTTNEIMISRNENTTTEEEKTTEKKETTEQREQTTSNVESREIETTVAPVQPEPVTQPEPEPDPVPEPTPPTGGTVHSVSSGESWWSIARTYGVDPYELAAYNGMTIESALYPGLQVQVP